MKKGFTLIELLAVIVILAVIALISVPLLLGVIEDSKKASFKDTAYGLIASAELYYAKAELKETTPVTTFNCDYNTCGELTFKGAIPKGILTIYSDSSISLSITNGKYCAYKNGNQSDVTVVEGDCNGITVMQYAAGNSTDETTTNLQNQIKSLQEQIVSLQTDNEKNKTDNATNQTNIEALQTSNTSTLAALNTLQTNNSSLNSSITTIQGSITTLQTKDASLTTSVNALQTSVNNAKQNLIYALGTERVTGDKWVDGKPIYAKTIDFGALPNATSKSVAHGIANVKTIWIDLDHSYIATPTAFSPLSFPHPTSVTGSIVAFATTTNVTMTTGIDRTVNTAYITVLYTKTTD